MLHKQIVFAAIAVTALMGLIVPLTVPAAQAQVDTQGIIDDALEGVFGDGNGNGDGDDGGDEQGDDNQNIDQTNEQEQEAEQEVEQNNDQSETNAQSNELNTGDNTATVTQANAADQAVEAAAAAESGDAEAEAEDETHNKGKKSDYSYSDSTSADADSIATATAEATGIIEQDNEANIDQDSSANDNVLANFNEFGDDTNEQVAVPIIDQDQTAENRAANIDVEEDIDDEYGEVVNGGNGGNGDECPEGFELAEVEVPPIMMGGGVITISVCVEED